MKTFLALLACFHCVAGDFLNLTFDEPDLSGPLTPTFPDGPFRGNTSQLLPGWTVMRSGVPQATMLYSPVTSTTRPFINLYENTPADAATVLGSHSLLLNSPFPEGGEIRLSQQGTIPSNAGGLWIGSAGLIQAFVNGTKVGEVNPVLGSHAVLNVSPYAGQEVQLEFLVREFDSARFDIFGFTVPEPSTWALLGVGMVWLCWLGCRRKA